jgi:hypothetical protein
MLRYACFTLLLAASGMIAVKNLPPASRIQIEDECLCLDADIIAWRTQKLDAARRGVQQFSAALQAVVGALAREEICLCRACELVCDRSRAVFPAFLRNLACRPGSNDKEKIASVLLGHLRYLAAERPEVARVVAKLEHETRSETFLAWRRQSWE